MDKKTGILIASAVVIAAIIFIYFYLNKQKKQEVSTSNAGTSNTGTGPVNIASVVGLDLNKEAVIDQIFEVAPYDFELTREYLRTKSYAFLNNLLQQYL